MRRNWTSVRFVDHFTCISEASLKARRRTWEYLFHVHICGAELCIQMLWSKWNFPLCHQPSRFYIISKVFFVDVRKKVWKQLNHSWCSIKFEMLCKILSFWSYDCVVENGISLFWSEYSFCKENKIPAKFCCIWMNSDFFSSNLCQPFSILLILVFFHLCALSHLLSTFIELWGHK